MYKIDTHVHTKEVSPCGRLSAEEVVQGYKAQGYDAIVVTDHFHSIVFERLYGNTWEEKVDSFLEGYRAAKKYGEKAGLRVFLGMEFRSSESDNDFLCYGIDRDFLVNHEKLYDKPIKEAHRIMNECGIVVIQAHPFRVMCTPAPADYIDGVEIYNGHFEHNSHNDTALEYGIKIGKLMTSGSDTHDMKALGNGGLIFDKEPETDNFAEILKTSKYDYIKMPPK